LKLEVEASIVLSLPWSVRQKHRPTPNGTIFPSQSCHCSTAVARIFLSRRSRCRLYNFSVNPLALLSIKTIQGLFFLSFNSTSVKARDIHHASLWHGILVTPTFTSYHNPPTSILRQLLRFQDAWIPGDQQACSHGACVIIWRRIYREE